MKLTMLVPVEESLPQLKKVIILRLPAQMRLEAGDLVKVDIENTGARGAAIAETKNEQWLEKWLAEKELEDAAPHLLP